MRRVFAVLIIGVICALVLPLRAGAATGTAPKMALVDQPPWVTDNGVFPLRLRISPAAEPGLQVRVSLHDHVNTRSNFEETVAGANLGGIVDTASLSLDGAPKGASGIVLARFGLPGSNVPSDQVLRPPGTGVYPLSVELRSANGVLDQFVTWLVYVRGANSPGAVAEPLRFTWVWSVVAPPAHGPDGQTPDPAVLSALLPGGRLEKIASLLPKAKGVPLTLDVSPETLRSWVDFAQERAQLRPGANAVRTAASSSANNLLPAPYVPIDLPAFENAGLDRYLSSELIAGAGTLRRLTGIRVDPRTAFLDPVDGAALGQQRSFLVDQVLVRDHALNPQEPPPTLTAARPFSLPSGDSSVVAASTNPTVESWLEGPQPAALRAQRFIAGLSLIALEAPSAARGIVAATPRDWSPDSAVVTRVLRALRADPLVKPVTLTQYFATLPHDTDPKTDVPITRTLAPSTPGGYPVSADQYAQARRTLASFRSLVGTHSASVARGEQALLVALTSMFSTSRANAELAVVGQKAADFLSQITTTQQRVTLTARRAGIPLTFRNATEQAVRVRVLLAAPSGKALFPDGAEKLITLQPGNQTVRFTVEARATGTFAMIVTLTSEDGQLPIGAPTQITVRSTVFSGWGAALTIGAVLFLALWWANHIWRSRRAARAVVATA
ncbi:MAG: hypothetical protein JWL83_3715 [Actinomycetia bacterium]|nr:hypothetical protein [Actinomycetes bacterium]